MTEVRRTEHDVATPAGTARLHVRSVDGPRAVLVLGHGAGRGTDTDDLLGIAEALPGHGVAVVLVDQPWVLAGRRVATPPATLDVGWTAALDHVRTLGILPSGAALVVGGRSAGARVACRTCASVAADAVLLLAFPFLPPSARASDEARERALGIRLGEIALPLAAGLPVVVVQGARDPFGTPALVGLAPRPGLEVVEVPDADHALRVRRGAPDPAPVLIAGALRAVAAALGE